MPTRRHYFALVLWGILFLALSPAALAQRRVALVIGNAAYEAETPLANPVADAGLIANVLQRDLGFGAADVILKINLGRRHMIDAVEEFARKARGADVAFVYYSGHGMQAGGANYLIPVDADIKDGAHVRRDSVAVSEILEKLEEASPRLAVLVLDACRGSPFASRTKSIAKGLVRMNVSGGNLLVAYAAQEGSTAADGTQGNSPYAMALANSLKKKDLRVLEQFDDVAVQVRKATSNAQRPTRYGDVPVSTYLVPEAARAASASTTAFDAETEAWELAKRANTMAGYEAFRRRYPSSRYKDLADIAWAALVPPRPADESTRNGSVFLAKPLEGLAVQGRTIELKCEVFEDPNEQGRMNHPWRIEIVEIDLGGRTCNGEGCTIGDHSVTWTTRQGDAEIRIERNTGIMYKTGKGTLAGSWGRFKCQRASRLEPNKATPSKVGRSLLPQKVRAGQIVLNCEVLEGQNEFGSIKPRHPARTEIVYVDLDRKTCNENKCKIDDDSFWWRTDYYESTVERGSGSMKQIGREGSQYRARFECEPVSRMF